MKLIIVWILTTLLISSCNIHTKSNENTTNKEDHVFVKYNLKDLIYPIQIVDTNGKIIKNDTLPYFVHKILEYSKTLKDTTQIKINTANYALEIARKELELKFGTNKVKKTDSLSIALIDNKFWYINGHGKPNYFGGTPEIIISKYDGKIIYISIMK